MPMGDIKYNSNVIMAKLGEIKGMLDTYSADERSAYEVLLSAFSASEGDQATAVRNLLENEKQLVENMTSFYLELVNMLLEAKADIEKVEEEYSSDHLEKQ